MHMWFTDPQTDFPERWLASYSGIIRNETKNHQNPQERTLVLLHRNHLNALFSYPCCLPLKCNVRLSPHTQHPALPLGARQPAGLFQAALRPGDVHPPPPGAQAKVQPAARATAVTTRSGMQTPAGAGTESNSHLSGLIHPGGKGVCGHDCESGFGLWNRRKEAGTCRVECSPLLPDRASSSDKGLSPPLWPSSVTATERAPGRIPMFV